MQQFQQGGLQRGIAVRGAQRQDVRAFAPQHGVYANLQLVNGEKFRRGTRHHERQSISRHPRGQPAQYLFSAFIGKQQFPTNASVATQHRRSRRRDFQAVAISLDERAAAHVPLNQPFRFQFRVRVRHRGAVYAQHGGQFAACRNAVARAQITGMHQGAQLIAKLNI